MRVLQKWMYALHSILTSLIMLYIQSVESLPAAVTDTKLTTTKSPSTAAILTTTQNSTTTGLKMENPNKYGGMVTRGLYVLSIVCGLVVLYLIARWVCSRRRQSKTRRYGVLNDRNHDSMEMRPLSEDDDDDDDDLTLFDASKQKRKNKR